MNHTSGNQDRDIDNAVSSAKELASHAEAAAQHIADLISIIEDLDVKLDEKAEEIRVLERRLAELES